MATNIADARTLISGGLSKIAALRVSKYPPDDVNIPCAFVGGIVETFDETFEGGSRLAVNVSLLVAKADQGISRGYAALEPYLSKSGASSIYAQLEALEGVWVISADDTALEYAGGIFIGASFTVGVMG